MTYQKSVRKVTYGFIGLILFFTFFSKTIKNINTPIVEVSGKESGYLINLYRGNGEVKPENLTSYYLPASLIVDSVEIVKGEEVEIGDVLLKINREKFNDIYNRELKSFLQLKNSLSSKNRELSYLETGSPKIEELSNRVELKAKELETSKWQFEEGYISKKDLDSHTSSYNDLKLNYLEEVQRENNRIKELSGEIEILNLELPGIESRVSKLKEIKGSYTFRSEDSGTIYSIGITDGGVTRDDLAVVTIINGGSNYCFKGSLDSEAAKEVKVGDHATVYLEGKSDISGVVSRVLTGSGSSSVYIDLEDGDISGSEAGSFMVKCKSRYYESIIPRDALRGGGRNRFVYVANREEGALSTYSKITKVNVEIIEESLSQVAVIAPISEESKLVVYEDRPITHSVERVILR